MILSKFLDIKLGNEAWFSMKFFKKITQKRVLYLKVQLLNKIGFLDRGHLDINRLTTNNLTFPYAILWDGVQNQNQLKIWGYLGGPLGVVLSNSR